MLPPKNMISQQSKEKNIILKLLFTNHPGHSKSSNILNKNLVQTADIIWGPYHAWPHTRSKKYNSVETVFFQSTLDTATK